MVVVVALIVVVLIVHCLSIDGVELVHLHSI